MKLKARVLNVEAGGRNIIILAEETASLLGLHSSDRAKIADKNGSLIALVNVASRFARDHVGVYIEISAKLGIAQDDFVDVVAAEMPESLIHIREAIHGKRLRPDEIEQVVSEVVERHLSDAEIASFVTALYIHGLGMDEIEALSNAMVKTGSRLALNTSPILDKHSVGGIPGDKTTILAVPIVAAAGFVIPKTSSRAITSAAGTADRVECLCPVSYTTEEIREIVKKTNACMVWGGALELAPADDVFIQVEYPLAIDPLLLPSIMSKKKAIGATHVVVDIPTGRGAKIKTIGEAEELADDFIDLGKRLGIAVQCVVTYGEQPLGNAIGPALEAREALEAIMGNGPSDLVEKATGLAGTLLEMVGVPNGKQKAEQLLRSGEAEQKLRQIIEAQGGNRRIKPEEIAVGKENASIGADVSGRVLWINNEDIARVAREAGAPREKGAGVLLKAKLGDHVKAGDTLFGIYAERGTKLQSALDLAAELKPVGLSQKPETRMLVERIPKPTEPRKTFILER